MIDEDLKNRKIANGTYTEDNILYNLLKELKSLERKVEKTKMKMVARIRKIKEIEGK